MCLLSHELYIINLDLLLITRMLLLLSPLIVKKFQSQIFVDSQKVIECLKNL
jgi:hypothetical protein